MITIADILRAESVSLVLGDCADEEAIWNVSILLKIDPRVVDWRTFHEGLKTTAIETSASKKVILAHARTDAVSTMVMSAGRMTENRGKASPTRYFFVIGVPIKMAADYLRVIGALARVFKNEEAEKNLRVTCEARDFISTLAGTAAAL